jgi:hypothetical protein
MITFSKPDGIILKKYDIIGQFLTEYHNRDSDMTVAQQFYFNPFQKLIAPRASSPFSEILRPDLVTRFGDVFRVFFGNHYNDDGSENRAVKGKGTWCLGIVDYCLLGLSVLFELPAITIMQHDSPKRPPAYALLYMVPAFFLRFISIVIRALLSAVMTLLVSPIVILVHIAAKIVAKKDFEIASKLNCIDSNHMMSHVTTLGSCFSNKSGVLDGTCTAGLATSYIEKSKEYGIDYDVNKHDFHCVFAKQNGPLNDSPDQRESYNALVRLNLFGFGWKVEKCDGSVPTTSPMFA